MKNLIIYFSHAGENWYKGGLQNLEVGNTEKLANILKEITSADIFKVEEVNPYPYGYSECCHLSEEELAKNSRPLIKMPIPPLDAYDTIYICTPIWYSHMPMVMFTALEPLDFNGKTVKFIVTHEGSGLGSVPEDIKSLCKGGIIKRGLAITGSDVENSRDTLENYVKEND